MSTPVNRTNEYLLVRSMRECAGSVGQKISESTKRDYADKYRRMKTTGYLPEHAGTKRAFYAYRAALLHGISQEAISALRARDKAVYGSEPWQAAMAVLHRCQGVYKRYPPDRSKSHHEQGSTSFTWSDVKGQRGLENKPSLLHSKKSMLSKLRHIDAWREQLFAFVTPRHLDAAAVIALSGARPSEVARGVTVTLERTAQGERLLVVKGNPIFPSYGNRKFPTLVQASASSARTRPALSFSFRR